ncbi:MAG TPA: DUF397 domain-containing protein [Pseudonocardiaceae bacterium]|jgi:hypothetical protein|nr:DUF397 domain-containing protein [Pseudonocardiaceae bacterium]
MTELRWRKSSRSNTQTNCVELAHTLDLVRDSKNPSGPMLRVNLAALVAAAKNGKLD